MPSLKTKFLVVIILIEGKREAEEKPIPITKHGPTSDIMSLKIKIPINENKIKNPGRDKT